MTKTKMYDFELFFLLKFTLERTVLYIILENIMKS